jgi:hypothetical protein
LKAEYSRVVPASAVGKAIAYALKRWEKLLTYTTDGKLEIDNNLVENSIRPVALGSHDAARRSAIFYSLRRVNADCPICPPLNLRRTRVVHRVSYRRITWPKLNLSTSITKRFDIRPLRSTVSSLETVLIRKILGFDFILQLRTFFFLPNTVHNIANFLTCAPAIFHYLHTSPICDNPCEGPQLAFRKPVFREFLIPGLGVKSASCGLV